MLEFNIKNQTISRVDRFNPATDSVDYLTAKFDFLTSDWDGVTKKALFRSGTVSYEAAINSSGVCNVPWEVLVSPENKFSALSGGCIKIFVSVLGTLGTIQIPTKECRVEIGASGLNETLNGAAPTPNIYEQFVDTVKADNDTTVAEIKADNDETVQEIENNNANTKAEVETLTERAETAQTSAEQSAASMKNDYANALKGTASGEVVRVDDVSPVEHNPVVKVHSKNFFDISKIPTMTPSSSYAYISEVGNDYFIITTAATYDGNGYCTVSKTLKEVCPHLEVGKTYILTATTESNSTNVYLPAIQKSWIFGRPMVMTETILNSTMTFYGLSVAAGMGTGNCRISNIQIEVGDTATEYTPYIDPSTVTLTRCGKNIHKNTGKTQTINGVEFTVNADGSVTANGTATKATFIGLGALNVKTGEKYRLSGNPAGSGFDTYMLYIHNNTTGSDIYDLGDGKVFTGQSGDLGLTIAVYAGNTVNNLIFRPMVVYGEESGEFDTYNGATYTPEANGTCDIVSLSPTMTLFTDTEGVTVECEYNRDINKVIADLYNKLNG